MIFNFGRLMQREMGTEGNVLDINLIKMMVQQILAKTTWGS
jgi:hypothetical protein